MDMDILNIEPQISSHMRIRDLDELSYQQDVEEQQPNEALNINPDLHQKLDDEEIIQEEMARESTKGSDDTRQAPLVDEVPQNN